MTTNAVCTWDFTVPHDSISLEDLLKFIKVHCKKWCFQHEKGETTGYEHWQGRVSLKVKARKGPKLDKAHWSPTSNENAENTFYVMKEETRVSGPWSDKDAYIPRHVRDISLRPWQSTIMEDAARFDARTINVLYCPNGNIGKSTLAIWAGCRGLARNIPMMDSYKDYMRMVMDTPKVSLYFVDFPRSMNKTCCAGFWSAIETIKNGYAYDDRYGFREEYFDPPNIWVFTNTIPEEGYLSTDRWKYWVVEGDTLRRYRGAML